MTRSLLRASSAPFWAAIAAWLFVDRAAHGGAAGALPLAASVFAAGVITSLVLAKFRKVEPAEAGVRAKHSARAVRLGDLLIAAMGAVAAAALLAPIEIAVRAQPEDPWLLVAGRCAVHPVFAFAAAMALGAVSRPPTGAGATGSGRVGSARPTSAERSGR